MLSPAASLELSTEAQRHQKRVKEEEEGELRTTGEEEEEEEDVVKVRQEEESKGTWKKLEEGQKEQPESAEVTTMKVEGEQDRASRISNREEREEEEQREEKESSEKTKKEDVPVVEEGVERQSAPSYPSLNTSTSVNWCYRNYVKPNPSAQTDPRTSVYSTWSVSSHNPNLPGLSTKVALSLLCSKQKHSSETYTMATAPVPSKGNMAPATSKTPCVSEVNINIIYIHSI